jgi:hypothetical protein
MDNIQTKTSVGMAFLAGRYEGLIKTLALQCAGGRIPGVTVTDHAAFDQWCKEQVKTEIAKAEKYCGARLE